MSGSYEPDYWKLKNQRLVYWLCIVKFKERTVFAKFPKDILGILTELVRNQPLVESGDACRIGENYWRLSYSFWIFENRLRTACVICKRPNLKCRVYYGVNQRASFEIDSSCPVHISIFFKDRIIKFIE